MQLQELKKISQAILESKSIDEELHAANLLSAFLEANNWHKDNFDKNNEHLLKGGVALSSFDASICVDDALRTARFIKSVFAAIIVLQDRFPNQKTNILYAGCGPFATLVLPLLPFFHKDDLDIILLDINASSLESVKNLISAIGFQQFEIQIVEANATTYTKPDSWPMHLLITETMFAALLKEPQVSITKNLAPQLVANGILIPEEINISFGYAFFGNEPFLQSNIPMNGSYFNNLNNFHKNYKNQLFTINNKLLFVEELNLENNQIESDFYELPKDFILNPDICIYTEIKIFADFRLHSSESYITNPYCLVSLFNISTSKYIQFCYQYNSIPKWNYIVKG
jgi:hypothetical protein